LIDENGAGIPEAGASAPASVDCDAAGAEAAYLKRLEAYTKEIEPTLRENNKWFSWDKVKTMVPGVKAEFDRMRELMTSSPYDAGLGGSLSSPVYGADGEILGGTEKPMPLSRKKLARIVALAKFFALGNCRENAYSTAHLAAADPCTKQVAVVSAGLNLSWWQDKKNNFTNNTDFASKLVELHLEQQKNAKLGLLGGFLAEKTAGYPVSSHQHAFTFSSGLPKSTVDLEKLVVVPTVQDDGTVKNVVRQKLTGDEQPAAYTGLPVVPSDVLEKVYVMDAWGETTATLADFVIHGDKINATPPTELSDIRRIILEDDGSSSAPVGAAKALQPPMTCGKGCIEACPKPEQEPSPDAGMAPDGANSGGNQCAGTSLKPGEVCLYSVSYDVVVVVNASSSPYTWQRWKVNHRSGILLSDEGSYITLELPVGSTCYGKRNASLEDAAGCIKERFADILFNKLSWWVAELCTPDVKTCAKLPGSAASQAICESFAFTPEKVMTEADFVGSGKYPELTRQKAVEQECN
jgi:hypothetical protein